MTPNKANGTLNMTAKGFVQLSYIAAKTKITNIIARTKIIVTLELDNFS